MKSIIIKFWPVFFILAVWFVFTSPYFIKGKVPFPSTYQVNHFPPWSHYEKFWGPVKNGAMPDIIDQIYPWKHFDIQMWKNGQIPLWNPYNFSGNPHLANFQSAVFSPFNLLYFILPFVDSWSIIVLLQPLLAAFFTYLMMRGFKVSKTGSVISSISFMFCGFIVVWMAYGTLSLAISFLPLAIFAIKRSFDKYNLFSLTLLSVTIPLSLFSGHFQTSLYFLIFVFSFFIFETIKTGKLKNTGLVLISLVLGIIFSLPQILPSIQFYLESVRSGIFIKDGGISLYYLVNIFSPDFFGNPVTRNDWFGYYAEWASFVGIIPLTLSLFSFFTKKRSLPFFFFIIGVVTLILAVDSPVQAFIGLLKIPVLSTSAPARIIVLFSFSFVVLAGFGLDNLKQLIMEKKIKIIIIPFLLVGLLFLSIWVVLLMFQTMPVDKLVIAKRNLILPTVLFSGTGIFILLAHIKKKFMLLSFALLLLAVSFDSLRFAQKWMPFDPKDLVFPDTAVIQSMQKNIGYGRYYGNLGAQVASFYNLSSVEGYDPLYIGRYGEFIRTASTGEYLKGERSVVKLDGHARYVSRVLDLLSVSIIFNPIADTNQSWAFPVWSDNKRYSLIYQDDKFQLFRNNYALPKASLYYDYEVIQDGKELLKRFYSDDFDFRKKLILEEKIGNFTGGNGKVNVAQYTPNYIRVEVSTDRPALLFLSDNYYPAWKAKVNSKEVKVYRADYTFRAVSVPKGGSVVEFYYNFF